MEKSVRVLTLNNQIEAKFLEVVLKEKNIPYLIKSYHDSAYDGVFQHQLGWGYVAAPENYKEEILEIYKEITK